MAATKILIIGIDAGDKDLISQWAAEGHLPVFARLFNEAARGTTQNPPGLFVGALWASFSTATSPARHGRYGPRQLQAGSYAWRRFASSEIRGDLFWETLSAAGKRSAIIDVPRIRLARNMNGIQLFNWLSHDPEPEGFTTWPSSLAGEVVSRWGANPLPQCDGKRSTAAEFGELRDILLERVRRKADLCRHFLSQGSWDLFLAVFTESHCAGHQTWHLHDRKHPAHDAEVAGVTGNILREVYRGIDAAMGALIEQAGPDTTVFVLASHGMGSHFDGTAVLDKMLKRLEERYDPLMPWRRRFFPAPLSTETKQRLDHRLCFKTPNNNVYGSIRLNLKGREPRGRIKPGAARVKFCSRLTGDLLAFVNRDTGEPVIRRVWPIEELYPGEETGDLPDLLVEWNRNAPIERVTSAKTGPLEGFYKGVRTGDHKPEGLFFAKGPEFPPRPFDAPVSVMDLAPTFTELLGVPLAGMQGRSLVSRLQAVHAH